MQITRRRMLEAIAAVFAGAVLPREEKPRIVYAPRQVTVGRHPMCRCILVVRQEDGNWKTVGGSHVKSPLVRS